MKYSISNAAKTKADLRKKTTAASNIIYQTDEGGGEQWLYKKGDKTGDNDDTCIVTANGLRFHKFDPMKGDLPDLPKVQRKGVKITFGNLEQTETGQPLRVSVSSLPSVEGIEIAYFMGTTPVEPIKPGVYTAVATLEDDEYFLMNDAGKEVETVVSTFTIKAKPVPVPDPTPTPAKTILLDAAKITGAYKADALSPDLLNVAGKSEGGMMMPGEKGFLVKTKSKSLDQSISFKPAWTNFHFLRINDEGKALFLWYKPNGTGQIYIGWIDNFADLNPWNFFWFTDNAHAFLKGLGEGNKSGEFTFSATGLKLTAAYNGVTFFNQLQYKCLLEGHAGVMGDGVSSIRFDLLPDSEGGADVRKKIIDLSKVLKSGLTTGSITGNRIKLKDRSAYAVGSRLIMATGGEEGKGKIGTTGVGKYSWPGPGYPTLDALKKADPKQKYSWAHDTGLVYQRYETGWWPKEGSINHYINKAVPAAYRGTIKSIEADGTLIMDEACNVPATDAEVWFDNDEILYPLISQLKGSKGVTVRMPKGRFYTSEPVVPYEIENLTIDAPETVFHTPKGAVNIRFKPEKCPGLKQNGPQIELRGRLDDFSFQWWGEKRAGNEPLKPDVNNSPELESLQAGFFIAHSDKAEVEALTLKNGITGVLNVSTTKFVIIRKSSIIHETGPAGYTAGGWAMVASDGAEDCTFEDVTFDSPIIYGFAESFGSSKRTKFIRLKARNGQLSSNTATDMQVLDSHLRYTKNARLHTKDINDPLINFNLNTNRQNVINGNGVVKNTKFVFEDYLDEGYNFQLAIVVQEGYGNATFENVEFTWDVPYKPGAQIGCIGIRSTGVNTTVRDCKAYGGTAQHAPVFEANIGITDGTLERCEGDTLAVITGSLIDCKATKRIYIGPTVKVVGTYPTDLIKIVR